MVFFYDPSNPYGGVRSGANPDEYAVRKGRGIMGYGVDPERRARIMRELRAGKKGRGIMGYGIDPERRARIMKALRDRRGSGIMGYGWPGVKLRDLVKLAEKPLVKGSKIVMVKKRDPNTKEYVKSDGYYIDRVATRAFEVPATVNGKQKTYLITREAIKNVIKGMRKAKATREATKAEFEKRDDDLRKQFQIDELKGINADFATDQRRAYRLAKAKLKYDMAKERHDAGKSHPWAIHKKDKNGNIKTLPGMTQKRFEKIMKYLNAPNANVKKYKARMRNPWRTDDDFFNKWVDFDNKDNETYGTHKYSPQEEKWRQQIKEMYDLVKIGETPAQKKRKALNDYISSMRKRVLDNDEDAKKWMRYRSALQTDRRLKGEDRVSPFYAALYANRMMEYDDPLQGLQEYGKIIGEKEVDAAIKIVDGYKDLGLDPAEVEARATKAVQDKLFIKKKDAKKIVNTILDDVNDDEFEPDEEITAEEAALVDPNYNAPPPPLNDVDAVVDQEMADVESVGVESVGAESVGAENIGNSSIIITDSKGRKNNSHRKKNTNKLGLMNYSKK